MIYVPVYPDIHGRYWVATNARNHTRLGETRMTNEIVQRLRGAKFSSSSKEMLDVCEAGADEIERLQDENAALKGEAFVLKTALAREKHAHEPGATPFDRAAIMGDPGNRRISMSFETQAQYEAALAFLDMSDSPEKSSERQLCIQCTGWMDEHRHWCPSLKPESRP